MSSGGGGPAFVPMRVFLVAAAATAIVAAIIAAERISERLALVPEDPPVATRAAPGDPIAAEAQVFRTRIAMLAIEPTSGAQRAAHPRSLTTWRSLRAYPGAPPRIPHGLTPEEFRSGGCKTCHERGGFSQRHGAFVPLSPHPEMGACLQCHVGDAKLMAIALPSTDPSARCRQCHAPGAMRWRDSTLAWAAQVWPPLTRTTRGRTPPPIPHALEMRGNCLSCHTTPSGVAEIRTPHPERTNCRQCHVTATAGTREYVRPSQLAVGGREGAPR